MLDLISTQIPMEYVEAVIQGEANPTEPIALNVVYWLIAINIIVTILSSLLNFLLQRGLKKQDVITDRKKIISNKVVEVESYIYEAISNFASFQYNENHQLLDAIEQLQTYVNGNQLYIRNKPYKVYIEIVDYYSIVCSSNFKRKDPLKEGKLLNKYKKAFNE